MDDSHQIIHHSSVVDESLVYLSWQAWMYVDSACMRCREGTGEVVWRSGAGVATRQLHQPRRPVHLFTFASLTRTLNACLCLPCIHSLQHSLATRPSLSPWMSTCRGTPARLPWTLNSKTAPDPSTDARLSPKSPQTRRGSRRAALRKRVSSIACRVVELGTSC